MHKHHLNNPWEEEENERKNEEEEKRGEKRLQWRVLRFKNVESGFKYPKRIFITTMVGGRAGRVGVKSVPIPNLDSGFKKNPKPNETRL